MILSFLVYFSTLGLIWILLSTRISNQKFLGLDSYTFIAILYYSIIMGMRYGVGMDYFNYLSIYEDAINDMMSVRYLTEPAFYYLTDTLATLGLHYGFFFGIIAFIQIYFLALTFKDNKRLLKYIILAFFALSLLSWMNGLRQIISLSIFIYAIQYIKQKSWLKYYLLTILAIMFHNLGALLLVMYPAFRVPWHRVKWNIPLQVVVYVFSIFFAFGKQIDNLIFNTFGPLVVYLGYDSYSTFESKGDTTRGIGFMLSTMLNLILISYSNKAKLFFKHSSYTIYYALFFIGLLWGNFTFPSLVMGRPNYFMFGLRFITVGYILFYLNRNFKANRINKLAFYTLIGLLILLISAQIVTGEEITFRYLFNWMNNLDSYNYVNQ